ncbi:MAG: DNA translocase FtsK [Clostridia bacterium]
MTTVQNSKKFPARKIVSLIFVILSAIIFICLITGKYMFKFGRVIAEFFFGCFGLSSFGILISIIAVCAFVLADKKIQVTAKQIICFILLYYTIVLFVHLATSSIYLGVEVSYVDYIKQCYNFNNYPSFGGVIAGAVVYPVAKTSMLLAYFLFIVCMLLMLFLSVFANDLVKTPKPVAQQPTKDIDQKPAEKQKTTIDNLENSLKILYGNTVPDKQTPQKEYSTTDIIPLTKPTTYPEAPISVFDKPIEEKPSMSSTDREFIKPTRPFDMVEPVDADAVTKAIREKKNKEKEKINEHINNSSANANFDSSQILDLSKVSLETQVDTKPQINPFYVEETTFKQVETKPISPQPSPIYNVKPTEAVSPAEIYAKQAEPVELDDEGIDEVEELFVTKEVSKPKQVISYTEKPIETEQGKQAYQIALNIKDNVAEQLYHYKPYISPPIDLLNDSPIKISKEDENYNETAKLLEDILTSFRIEAKVENIVPGPTVTRYELRMAPGISIKRVMALADDIGINLSAVGMVRIEPQIFGKDLFGIEVPNRIKETVALKTVIDTPDFYRAKGNLTFALGTDIGGKQIVPDLADMPHLLIAGSTGTGKSVLLNSLIISLMYKYSPEELRFILVDPKQVEFFIFASSPHLLVNQVVTDPEQCISSLSYLIDEMERRYTLFKELGAKDVLQYNNMIDKETTQLLPRIVLVIDELNDLMTYHKQDLEGRIKSLAQKARAAGIHLVFATQRPSVDVLTGTIKANFPCRVALRVVSGGDSKTILDQGGPEKLLGKGDMLYMSSMTPKPVRLQGALVTMGEVEKVLTFIARNNTAYFDEEISNKILKVKKTKSVEELEEELDPYFIEALRFCVESNNASISMLQRRFSIGYSRAGRLIEEFDRRKYISNFDGSKSRKVLITMEEFNELYGE